MSPVDESKDDWGSLRQKDKQRGSWRILLSTLVTSIEQEILMYDMSLVRYLYAIHTGVFARPPPSFKNSIPEILPTSQIRVRISF